MDAGKRCVPAPLHPAPGLCAHYRCRKRSDGGGRAEKRPKGKGKGAGAEREVAHNHKEQKEMRKKRKALENPNFDMMEQVKGLWEKARDTRSGSKAERTELVGTIVATVAGKMHDVIFQHDSVRVLQTCLKHGSAEHRAAIYEELQPFVLELIKSKYGSFLVPKLLQYSTKAQRSAVIAALYGKVRKLVKNRTSASSPAPPPRAPSSPRRAQAPVVALVWVDYATAEERSALLQEFYGPQFEVFKESGAKGGSLVRPAAQLCGDPRRGLSRALPRPRSSSATRRSGSTCSVICAGRCCRYWRRASAPITSCMWR